MRKIMIIILLICACNIVHAQINLVYNGSFENVRRCPDAYDEVDFAFHWNGIDSLWDIDDTSTNRYYTYSLPDLMSTCGTTSAVNCNVIWQYPRTGNNMMNMVLYYNYYGCYDSLEQNYLQGRIIHALLADTNYCVTFYVKMGHRSQFAINKIAAYLDDGGIDTISHPARPLPMYIPQVIDSGIISDSVHWTKIEGSFIANGTEKFITIGVFGDTSTLSKNVIFTGGCEALYFIDDVSVINSNATAYAGNDTTIRPGDTVMLGPAINGDGMPCYWYKLGGTAPIDSGGNIWVHPDSTTTYVVEMDLCGVVTRDTVTVTLDTTNAVGILPATSKERYAIYPNPNNGYITIMQKIVDNNPVGVNIWNATGNIVYKGELQFNSGFSKLQMTNPIPGLYLIQLIDSIGNKFTFKFTVD